MPATESNALEENIEELNLLTQFVGIFNVLGVVLVMMDFQSALGDMRLQSIIGVRKRRQCNGHFSTDLGLEQLNCTLLHSKILSHRTFFRCSTHMPQRKIWRMAVDATY